jgi:hypothetical protein
MPCKAAAALPPAILPPGQGERKAVTALLTAARQSPDPCDFALVAMLGLLRLSRVVRLSSAAVLPVLM